MEREREERPWLGLVTWLQNKINSEGRRENLGTRLYFEFTHVRLSALRKLIFGVHGVQEMFFLSFDRLFFAY